jgi:polyvinyl alcohol dehydrogenase (cytochrome)
MAAALAAPVIAQAQTDSWPMFGQNLANTASAVSAPNAARLALKWTFTTGGDVSVRPAVVGNTSYFPDWAGNLYAIDARSGA